MDDSQANTATTDPMAGGCAFPFAVLAAILAYLLFENGGTPGRGETAAIFVIAIAVVLLDFRKSWKQIWFWVGVAVLLLAHAVVLFSFSWPRMDYDGQSAGGAALIDVLVCVGFIKLCEKLKRNRSTNAK